MSITLRWTNPVDPDEIVVYKATERFTQDTLPDVYVTIDGSSTSYSDPMVTPNTVYYYMVGKRVGSALYLSALLVECYMQDKGPGPTKVKFGDWSSGFMGFVNNEEVVDNIHLAEFIQSKVGVVFTPATNEQTNQWIKLVVDGRIIYVPTLNLNVNYYLTWNQVYLAGLAYGIDGPGYTPDGLTPTNQMTVLEHNNRKFIVRLMDYFGTTTNTNRGDQIGLVSINTSTLANTNTEFNLLRRMRYDQTSDLKLPFFTFTQGYMGNRVLSDGYISQVFPGNVGGEFGKQTRTTQWSHQHFVLELLPIDYTLKGL